MNDILKPRVLLPLMGAGLLALVYGIQWMRNATESQRPVRAAAEVRPSAIHEGPTTYWSFTSEKIGEGEDLSYVSYVSAETVWVGGQGRHIYRTMDGGKTWSGIGLPLERGGWITAMDFASGLSGWVAVVTNGAPSSGEAQILYTDDGGRNWQVQFRRAGFEVGEIKFVDQQEGWATGRNLEGGDKSGNAALILHTLNRGSTWAEVSNKFNLASVTGEISKYNFALDSCAHRPGESIVLTNNGHLLRTVDGGDTWRLLGEFNQRSRQMVFSRMYCAANNKLWLVGGTDNKEGMQGLLAYFDGRERWVAHRVSQTYLSDVVHLGDNHLIACGSTLPLGVNTSSAARREGVILHSADGGNTWTIIYRHTEVGGINSLAVTDNGRLWAVGAEGIVLQQGSLSTKFLTSP